MRHIPILVIPLALTAMLASCGSDAERVSDEEFATEARRLAETVLLTKNDLPDGWFGTPPADSEEQVDLSDADLEGVSEDCRGWIEFVQGGKDVDPALDAVVEVDSDTFGDSADSSFSSTVEIFRNQDELENGFSVGLDLIDRCGDEANDVFTKLLERELRNDPTGARLINDVEGHFEIEVVDGLGDQALRLDSTISFQTLGIPFELDIAAGRSG